MFQFDKWHQKERNLLNNNEHWTATVSNVVLKPFLVYAKNQSLNLKKTTVTDRGF